MEFRTRKAHRWVVRDKDLLKYLMGMVLIMVAYLSAWTAVTLNFLQEGYTVLRVGETPEGFHFQACKTLWWDYVTEAGEKHEQIQEFNFKHTFYKFFKPFL